MILQQRIIQELGVQPTIDPQREFERRVKFVADYLEASQARGIVLGISGGQDSTLTGIICKTACQRVRARFLAVRLPYGSQRDEQDCQDALCFIQPWDVAYVDIRPAVDAALESLGSDGLVLSDFCKGNRKARERMAVQYDLAAHYGMLVAGTDHAAEAITGFFTKFGDGACDLTPLYGLNKRQGRQLLQYLECPAHLYLKTPTADLEDDRPALPDEEALGLSYDEIDDYLEGKHIDPAKAELLEQHYIKTQHKRHGPVTPEDTWWHGMSFYD